MKCIVLALSIAASLAAAAPLAIAPAAAQSSVMDSEQVSRSGVTEQQTITRGNVSVTKRYSRNRNGERCYTVTKRVRGYYGARSVSRRRCD